MKIHNRLAQIIAATAILVAAFSSFAFAANPTIFVDPLPLNITSNNTPTFTGIASSDVINIATIECRINGGSWSGVSAGPLDSDEETFSFTVANAMVRSTDYQSIEARVRDTNGDYGYYTYYFYVIGSKPEISIKENGRSIRSGDPMSSTPTFEIKVLSSQGLEDNTLYARLNSDAPIPLTKTLVTTCEITSLFNPTLDDGVYSLQVSIVDDGGNMTTAEVVGLVVQTDQEISIQGNPLCYPNPYNGTGNISVGYTLSKTSSVTFSVYDSTGTLLYKRGIPAGQDGAKVGYNEFPWNGKTSSGNPLANGIYVYFVSGEGKMLGKGKLIVIK